MTGNNPLFPEYLGMDLTQYALVALVSLGMALAFIVADRQSGTSRALAVAFAFIGISIDLGIVVGVQYAVPVWLLGWFGITEAIATIALLEWVLRVRRTVPAGALNTRTGDLVLRAGQASAVLYAVLSVALPQLRAQQFLGALAAGEPLSKPGFWLFVAPIAFSCLCALGGMLLLLNRRPDRPERVRVLAMIAAIPFMAGSMIVGLDYAALVMTIGLICFLVGAVEYHVLQGQRGQFMSRFLSPQVAELVSKRGLAHAMQESLRQLTVVCCDLRGFTAYAQAHSSSHVLSVLREYYDAVGAVVAEHGATIKDFAGDGVLVLVGAPLAQQDHARVGVEVARKIRVAVREVVRRASSEQHRLGIGVGVASGPVTVGVIGSSGRFEYTAVGPAVNLASRLCELARDGEVLVVASTREQCEPGAALEPRAAVPVKGYAEPVALFNLQDGASAA